MTLAEWLKLPDDDGRRKRKREFAAKIGVTPTMITEYAEGRAWPGKDKVEAIVRETAGAVTANDLLSDEARQVISAREPSGAPA